MHTRPRDTLLSVARFMLVLSMGAMLVTAAACAIAAPVAYVMRAEAISRLARTGAPPEAIWGIITVLGLLAASSILGYYFFRHLSRIVATVSDGDPFVPVNATRLRSMAWIVLGVQTLTFPISVIAGWVEYVTIHVRSHFNLSLAGLLLAVVLFILARVFREGTRMRDELEGTV